MNIVNNEERYAGNIYQRFPVNILKGKGCKVWDTEGREYIDCMGGYGVALVGHCNQKVVDALSAQINKLITCHMSLYNDTRLEFFNKLSNIAPNNLTKFFLTNSGTESVEAAIKFSRKFTNKSGIVSFKGGYHGKTMGSLSVTYNEKYRKSFLPLLENVKFLGYSEIDSLNQILNSTNQSNIGTVIVEPIQGESGIILPPPGFLQNLRKICDENGLILIFDEIQSGLGRTGKMWAGEHWNVEPDMMCLAKGIAGGVPMGVTLMRSEILDCIKIGEHSSTFAGNPLACAAATATIDSLIEYTLVANSQKMGKIFREGLLELKDKYKIIREVRGLGMMIGIEMKFDVKDILFDGIDKGILLLYSGKNIIRMLPPLVMDEENVKRSLEIMDSLFHNEEKRRFVR